MRSVHTEVPKMPVSARNRLQPLQVIGFDGHKTFNLYWYYKGSYFLEDPRYDYRVQEPVSIDYWEYLPEGPQED